MLAAKKTKIGKLNPMDMVLAEHALARGESLIAYGESNSGQTERFMGRILQIMDRHEDAVPLLQSARKKLSGINRSANDRALIEGLRKLGRDEEARAILEEAVQYAPGVAPHDR